MSTQIIWFTGVFYPVVVHWAWSPQGWLNELGFVDFAGGMLIHGLAGNACIVAAVTIGPRIGRFGSKNGMSSVVGHSTAVK